ncbi:MULTISPECIES: dCTP deaminase [Methanobacterium]|jgi:dCTP deaminase|uniref:dCTP deaminase, dUMP-forming n=1 Tax=Methanobacterium formicicum TaxID=2162 RepID=A0A090JTX4_METFO|nr:MULTISPECIES: dCTP deaminase [Methanobacterium]AIS31367.1 deoxycytidine triphosphate deaminase Dcd [Methanobacterium formicicum]KUK75363.1 MAG: putative deoxycytidine triphosphate deaminase [Methanobacterium sp. 42_16]MBF4475605.1 dCTP deaminase [Methanobacterium formicicum]MDD4809977.1 dCTP deaminase [Methanobacterium formicicum]MDG3547787.1 dCTP deaminase [Methanobacterium formicicum]
MAILSDQDIIKYLDEGKITIEPLEDPSRQIQPSSVDLRIGNEFKGFRIIRKPCIDPLDKSDLESYMESFHLEQGEAFIIHPGEFALATTYEAVKLPDDLVARVEGRSSMGRLGITMHVTAGYIDPGFEGKITLEISNIGKMPVALYTGQRVCQIVFETMTTPSLRPYGHPERDSKYMGQDKPVTSKIKQDYEIRDRKQTKLL